MANLKSLFSALLIAGLCNACSSSPTQPKPITGTGGASQGTGGAGQGTGGAGQGTGGAGQGTGGAGQGTGGTSGTGGAAGSDGGAADASGCTPACSATQTCIGGTCRPNPTKLTEAPGCGEMFIAVQGTNIVFTEMAKGTVKSVPVAGGAVTMVAMGQMAPKWITADATAVYWSNTGDKTVMKAVPPAAPTVLVPALTPGVVAPPAADEAKGMNINAGTLYFGRGHSTWKVPVGGGTAVMLQPSPTANKGEPQAVVADATHVYQAMYVHNSVTRAEIANPAAPLGRIAVSQGSLLFDAVGLDAGFVYWGVGDGVKRKSVTATEFDPAFTVVTSNNFNPISGFIVTTAGVFFGEDDTPAGTIQKGPLAAPDGGAPSGTVVATTGTKPSSFVQDAANIYWRTGECAIMKLAK